MFKKFKIVIFCCFFYNIISSISQTNENVPLNNIAQHDIPKPILPIIFEDFSGNKVNLEEYYGNLILVNFKLFIYAQKYNLIICIK